MAKRSRGSWSFVRGVLGIVLLLALALTPISARPEPAASLSDALAFVGAWDGNPDGGDTHQYTVNADGRITDFGISGVPVPIQAAAAPVPGGWNVEMRIPATHLFGLNATFTADKVLAFDLGLHDDDDGGNWDSHMIWAGDSTNYQAAGLLTLEDVIAPTPVPTSTPTATATPTHTPTSTPGATPLAVFRYLPMILRR